MTAENSAAASFAVMVKPVGSRCNMRCRYCYYLETDNGQDARPVMSDSVLETLIRNYLSCTGGPVVSFTWHGGEPALAGLDFYRRAVALQKKYLPEGWQCWNSLQTNGTLLDDEWCDFLAENRFDVGISIDGPQTLHDRYRIRSDGSSSFRQTADAVERLKKRGIQPDLLATVTSDTARNALETYRFLRSLGTGWIQFIPIVRYDENGGLTPDSVTPAAYGTMLKQVFSEWLYHDLGTTNVQMFAEMSLVLSGGQASVCTMAQECGRVPVIEMDGTVFMCDHFVNRRHIAGHVDSQPVADMLNSEGMRAFGKSKKDGLTAMCRNCAYLPLCGGGCLKDRTTVNEEGEGNHYLLCEGLHAFFRYAVPRMKRMLELKPQYVPESVMKIMRQEEHALWKRVGRNDPCPCGSGKKAKQCCRMLEPAD